MDEKERQKFRVKYGITAEDEAPYVLPEEADYEILAQIKDLESKNLSEEDREELSFIRTQLFADWRTPILEKLSDIKKKLS